MIQKHIINEVPVLKYFNGVNPKMIKTETKTVNFKGFELAELNAILEREEKRLTKIRLENLRNDSIYNYTSKELERIERIKKILIK